VTFVPSPQDRSSSDGDMGERDSHAYKDIYLLSAPASYAAAVQNARFFPTPTNAA